MFNAFYEMKFRETETRRRNYIYGFRDVIKFNYSVTVSSVEYKERIALIDADGSFSFLLSQNYKKQRKIKDAVIYYNVADWREGHPYMLSFFITQCDSAMVTTGRIAMADGVMGISVESRLLDVLTEAMNEARKCYDNV